MGDTGADGTAVPGVAGDGAAVSMREVVRRSGAGWYPIGVLGGVSAATGVGTYALAVLTPEIGRSLGIGPAGVAGWLTLSMLAMAAAALPLATAVQHRPMRARLVVYGGVGGGIALCLSAVAVDGPELGAAMLLSGVAAAAVTVSAQPLLVELYPPQGRVRALALLRAGHGLGEVAAPAVVGSLVVLAGLTWRGVFLVSGSLAALAAVAAIRLRDPGFGRWEAAEAGHAVPVGAPPSTPPSPALDLGPWEAARSLHTIPTLRQLFLFQAGLGAMILPFVVHLVYFLDVRWNLGPLGRGAVFSGLGVAAVAAVALFGPVGERLFHVEARRLVTVAARIHAAAIAAVVVAALAPRLTLVVAGLAVAVAAVAAIAPGLSALHLSLVPPQLRSTSSALAALYFAGAGGVLGVLLFGTADRRYGLAGALVATAVPGAVAVLLLHRAARTVDADLARVHRAAVEERRDRHLRHRGVTAPLLTVRRVRAGYGDRPILHGIDLTVDAGDAVALLGINGAGKTTLLRVLAGLLEPWSGTVRLRGRDVSYVSATRRSGSGIVLASGAATVFAPLTVDEHLRLYLRSARLDGADAAAARSRVAAAFPQLSGRSQVRAGQLSGGERQMLGLSRALVSRPELLMIDELSSGLSRDVLPPLVATIRTLADEGCGVLLVEQSLDVAVTVCERAVFLEHGRVRFDGRTADLAGRSDVLRPVFLSRTTR